MLNVSLFSDICCFSFSKRSFKTVKGTFIKNHNMPKPQNVVCSNQYDTLYPTDDSDESDSSSDAETLSSGSTSSNVSNYSNSKNINNGK